MGTGFSQPPVEQENVRQDSLTLPPQQIHSSMIMVPTRGAPTQPRVPVASSLNVNKRRMGIVFKQDSLLIRGEESSISMKFAYSASTETELHVECFSHPDKNLISETTIMLQQTILDGLQNFRDQEVKMTMGFGVTFPVMSFRLSFRNPDEALEVLGKYHDKLVTICDMNYRTGSSEIRLQQLFNAGSSTSSPTSRESEAMKTCPICLCNPISVGYLPCRHVCVCSECSRITLSSSENRCPICRSVVYGTISVD